MKIILAFAAALTISGCSTPFHEFYQPATPVIVDKSFNPAPTPVEQPKVVQKDEEEEVKTFAIDLDRN